MPMTPDASWNAAFVWPEETSVAFATRLRFVAEALRAGEARTVLDVGCGTGAELTAWLAELCPHCRFLGVDSDATSIAHAQQQFRHLPNVSFALQPPPDERYDVVIASEVLEHVADPYAFLTELHGRLHDDGRLILTTPNGYGCSEWMSLLETVLVVSGIWPRLRRLKRTLLRQRLEPAAPRDTQAISPHVNFFGLRRVQRVFRKTGWTVTTYRGRMFLHNFLWTMLIDRSRRLARLNAWLGRCLPAWWVSDWMFVLERTGVACRERGYRRNGYESAKRYLNLRRYGLVAGH